VTAEAATGGAGAAGTAVERRTAPHPTVEAVKARFGDAILRHEIVAGDEHVVFVTRERIFEVLHWLKDSPDHLYNFLSDVTAVDHGRGRPIQVVYQLFSIPHRRALRVKVELPLADLAIDSAVPLWATANWLEREVWDMYGVRFRGHPDLRRILMPENYAEGHPLRKDFPLRGRFSRAEQTRRALSHEVEDHYTAAELSQGGEPQVVPWHEVGGEPVERMRGDPSSESGHAAHRTRDREVAEAEGAERGSPGREEG
jgi:NADH-quinone oxidoreductase subunit C